MASTNLTVDWWCQINVIIMTTIESIQKRLEAVIVGSCVFNKNDIAEAIKNFYVVFCNEVVLTEDDILIISYDDVILKFKLTWEQVGPRYTLKAMKLL